MLARMNSDPAIYYDDKVTAAVPAPFRDAVLTAAQRRGMSMSDYTRAALASALDRDGINHPRILTTLGRLPCRPVGQR
jgi:hypothetical protein